MKQICVFLFVWKRNSTSILIVEWHTKSESYQLY